MPAGHVRSGHLAPFRALPAFGDGIADLFFRKRPLVLSHVDGKLKGIASLALPRVRCNGGSFLTETRR